MTSLLDTAVEAAQAAGRIIREGFGREHTITMKGVINPVTEVDHAAEAAIFQILRAATPEYGLLSEESGVSEGRKARWIIDPLDGTVNYAHGYPCFAVSIALEHAGQVELGVIYNPILDEMFVAERGGGARLNGRPIGVSAIAELSKSMVATGFTYDMWENASDLPELAALTRRAQTVRIYGAAVLDMAHVACGRMEAYWDTGLSEWDVAAGRLLIEEAGGIVSLQGGTTDRFDSQIMVASNPHIYDELCAVVLPPGLRGREHP